MDITTKIELLKIMESAALKSYHDFDNKELKTKYLERAVTLNDVIEILENDNYCKAIHEIYTSI